VHFFFALLVQDAAEPFDKADIPAKEYGKSLPPTFRFYYKLTLKAWAEFHAALKATRSQALTDVSKVQAPKACKLQAKESGDWDKPAEWASGSESGVLVSANFRGTSSRLLKAGSAAHQHQQVLDARSEGAAPAAAEALDPMALLEMEVMTGLHLGEDVPAAAAADGAAGIDVSVDGSVAAPAFFAGNTDPRFDLGSVGISRLSGSLSAWTQRLMDHYKQQYRWRINIPIPTVLLANCLAYATVSHYFLGECPVRWSYSAGARRGSLHLSRSRTPLCLPFPVQSPPSPTQATINAATATQAKPAPTPPTRPSTAVRGWPAGLRTTAARRTSRTAT
jgi:hypothetical protein